MRKIRFRCWTGKEMIVDCDLKEAMDKKYKIMEYTGVLDNNKVEVWEGDIINYIKWTHIVEFKKGSFGFEYMSIKEKKFLPLSRVTFPKLKVVGNMYETTTFLKEE